jgi:hypothetical protein
VFYRFAAVAALSAAVLLAQMSATETPTISTDLTTTGEPSALSESASPKADLPKTPLLEPDMTDPGVVRAVQDLDRVKLLISQGALPQIRLGRAMEELDVAKDLSILRKSIYAQDLLPEQADEMVLVAQRIVLRRQRSMIEMQQLVSSGVISRAEAAAMGADYDRAQSELHLAEARARLMQQMAESLRIERGIASLETQALSHPDWAGKVYTHYDGSGRFTPTDLQRVSMAYSTRFGHQMPISADGETAVHRSLGFDHRGRVDVAVSPDQPEGQWLMHFLETNRIPYFAFRMAVPGKATGAHIHIGPQSTRLVASY